MRVLHRIRRHPATLLVVVALLAVWVIAIPTGPRGPFSPPAAGLNPDALEDHHWWTILTSMLVAGGVAQFAISMVAAIVGVGLAERWMGSWRTLVAFVATGVVAGALGLGLELLGAAVHEFWSSSVRGLLTVDPLTPILGTLAWASAWAAPLERRRTRTLLVGVAATLLLYSGQPADLYLLVAVGLGIGSGALLRRDRRPSWPASRHETRSLLALVTVLFAVGPVLTAVSVGRYGVLSPLGIALTGITPRVAGPGCAAGHIAPDCVGELTRLPLHGVTQTVVSVLPLVLLLIGARGLLRGRRAAVVLLAGVGVAQGALAAWYFGVLPAVGAPWIVPLAPQRYWEVSLWLVVSTLVPVAYAIVLALRRRAFPIRMSRAGIRRAVLACAASLALPATGFVLTAHAIRGQFARPPGLLLLLAQTPQRFVPASFLRHQHLVLRPLTPLAHAVLDLPGVVFWIGLVVTAAIVLLRAAPVGAAAQHDPRLRSLLRAGSGSLGHLATWPENRLWVSADGSTGIAYRLVGEVVVTVSDPFGATGDPEAAFGEFLAFCDARAWTPVFYSVHEGWRAVLAARGWRSLPVAEETTLDPAAFTLSGRAMQDVRTAVNRARRTDVVTVDASWTALAGPLRRQIVAISEHWAADKRLPEMGFTLGGLDEIDDPDVQVVVAVDAQERVVAVTSWLPVWESGALVGRTLDMMRRAPDAPNGAMEFTIAESIEAHRSAGLRRTSLSATPLARPAEQAGVAVLGAVLALVGRLLEPVYGFRSLLRFKSKFGDAAEALHLVYRDPMQLPAIGAAIARCYLPQLTWGSSLRLLRG
ncbi:bifunctional lysylphosphatidylglycerol flippase/synthetase MprF [Pseudolysinimonas kribbensis]|uniref:DUF2156 domain-containing protein n=1 Tax=Pseudolysinimonas kribbensis TaxID=433641 RepID=UPI0031CE5745